MTLIVNVGSSIEADLPRLPLPARHLEDVEAELADDARLLGDADEFGGPDHAPAGMLPAHQRFDTHRRAGRHVDDRLIEDDELAVVDGALEVGAHLEPAGHDVLHPGFEDLDVSLPLTFARYIATSARPTRSSAVMSRDAVTATPIDALIVTSRPPTLKRDLNTDSTRSATRMRVLAIGGFLDEDRELVAAETCGRVRGAQHGLQAVGDASEQLVAGHVSEAVVDLLEVVEVKEHHRQRLPFALAACERVLETVHEQARDWRGR